ncbi:tetratricopeptide repeat protein [Marinicella rhabdoformis]|uniref:tetratricopeptide repeat protein n=1 Tax=Marinicella rhabdoformis TaxID=2580566 RepID=UPI0012AEC075|nr:tetratricopeptide repeat protein [Marinicella rhabdoformis]
MKIEYLLIYLMSLIFSGCATQPNQIKAEEKLNTDSKLATEYYVKAFELIKQSKDKEAIVWVEKAAELGHSKAQFLLGYMVDAGTAGYSQSVKAVHWYSKAAKQGNMDAQFNLGRMSKEERQVPEHYTNAVERKIKEEEYKSAQVNTVFVGKLLGYEDIPLVQPSSCFEPGVLCMDAYITYKIKVIEVFAGESLSGVINASRLQHGPHMYRGSDESLFVVTKIPDEKSVELLKASHYLREHKEPRTQYCFSESLDNYIPELKDFIYSTCTDVSEFRGEIKMKFLGELGDKILDKLTEDKTLIESDDGYSINGLFISDDVDDVDEEDDKCKFGLDYMDYDKLDNDPDCEGPKNAFEVVQYTVKKGVASAVKELITEAINQSKLELSTIEIKFKIIENEESSVLEWHYRNTQSILAETITLD